MWRGCRGDGGREKKEEVGGGEEGGGRGRMLGWLGFPTCARSSPARPSPTALTPAQPALSGFVLEEDLAFPSPSWSLPIAQAAFLWLWSLP